jgi:DNA-binding response OmpR family regulator
MKRIPFMDDEPQVLQGLQRTARPPRYAWHRAIAGGATRALARLEREPADVVVTDRRGPGAHPLPPGRPRGEHR